MADSLHGFAPPDANQSEPLPFLARVVRAAFAPPLMRSLPVHLAGTITSLAAYLAIRGYSALQHYYAEALTLTCLQPAGNHVKTYEALLYSFLHFDRRRPSLPPLIEAGSVAIHEQHAVHFISSLTDQNGFQAVYEAARQVDRYGAMARPRRKVERLVLFARELAGQSLLAPASPAEELYARLCE
jgi:hypothetical protein